MPPLGHAEVMPARHCRLCWLWHNRPDYRRKWEGQPVAATPPRGPCVHLGRQAGTVECSTCTGRVQLKLFACELHGDCTAVKAAQGHACCKTCKDWKGATP